MWHLERIPKRVYFYWGGGPLSFLRFMAPYSFHLTNPGVPAFMYVPKKPSTLLHDAYEGVDYMPALRTVMPVCEVDLDYIGFRNDAPELFKNDYFRWWILAERGGIFFDTDILFVRNIDDCSFNAAPFANARSVLFQAEGGGVVSIGAMFVAERNYYVRGVLERAKSMYDRENFQSIGTFCFGSMKEAMDGMDSYGYEYCIGDPRIFYIAPWYSPRVFWSRNLRFAIKHAHAEKDNVIVGYHWYGGAPVSIEHNKKLTHETYAEHVRESFLCEQIAKLLERSQDDLRWIHVLQRA